MSVPINPDINLKSETGELPVPGSEQYTQILLIQLILAEKRTSLSLMRTAIAIFSLPLSVATVLIASGFTPTALTVQGWGETHPVGDNDTEDGRALNRRVVIIVTP